MGRALILACALCAAATGSAAQTRISPDTFLDAAVGKTLTFRAVPSGNLVGIEFFLSRTETRWEQVDGTCTRGRITTPDGMLCFLYDYDPDNVPVCWWPFIDDGRLLVRIARFDDDEVQEVSDISTEPFYCGGVPLS